MLAKQAKKLESLKEQKAALTTQLNQVEADIITQTAALKIQLLALLPPDTPLFQWFKYKEDIDLLLKLGQWKSEIYFESDGVRSFNSDFADRSEAIKAFKSLNDLWSGAVTLGDIEQGGNHCTSYVKVQMTLQ